MRVVVMLVVLVGAMAPARADAPDVGVVVLGDTAQQKQVREHVRQWVGQHGFAVVRSPLSKDATNTFDNCFLLEDLKCARGVFDARSRSANLVYVSVDADNTFTVYWFVKDQVPTGDKLPCPSCDEKAWTKLVDDELAKLSAAYGTLPVTKHEHVSKFWPAVLLGTGIAAMGAGGALIYVGSLDGVDRKFIRPDALPIGIVVGAVGAGATIGGILLLSQAGSRHGSPVASVGSSHAYVGWVTRF